MGGLGDEMSTTPDNAELERGQRRLEERLDKERTEMLGEVRAVGTRLELAIGNLSFVHPEVFLEGQARQDAEVAALKQQVTGLRNTFIGGFVVVIGTGVAVQLLAATG